MERHSHTTGHDIFIYRDYDKVIRVVAYVGMAGSPTLLEYQRRPHLVALDWVCHPGCDTNTLFAAAASHLDSLSDAGQLTSTGGY